MKNDSNPPTIGQKAAELVARTVGSWKFIIIQSIILTLWVIFNVVAVVSHWDPYPFILMNLFLSLQAAYTAPMILMSQNRKAEKDRQILYEDWETDHAAKKIIEQVSNSLQKHMDKQDEILAAILEKHDDKGNKI